GCVVYLYPLHTFLFKEENGIRDRNVTGVHTCALPIYKTTVTSIMQSNAVYKLFVDNTNKQYNIQTIYGAVLTFKITALYLHLIRSEERRVGKEMRYKKVSVESREREAQ